MTNSDRVERIMLKLEQALSPSLLKVIDDSHKHIGHAGAKDGKGHFTVIIHSPEFTGKRSLQCHQMVYQALGDMMTDDIHALSIQID